MITAPRIVLVAVLASALTSALVAIAILRLGGDRRGGADGRGSEAELHDWMHRNLGLREEQEAALHALEAGYERERSRLRAEIEAAGLALSSALEESADPDSAAAQAALQRLETAQSELRLATLRHLFAMREPLDPEQADRLLKWTRESITRHEY